MGKPDRRPLPIGTAKLAALVGPIVNQQQCARLEGQVSLWDHPLKMGMRLMFGMGTGTLLVGQVSKCLMHFCLT